MTPTPLENLVAIGKLRVATHALGEIDALIVKSSGLLQDALRPELSLESRFTLAYTAAHGFALAALWRRGYRSDDRYTVFEALVHTSSFSPAAQRVLVNAHRARNQMEYEADNRVDRSLLDALLSATQELARVVAAA
jgi:hypothetical protein